MKTIKNIIAESGEDCSVDVDMLHEGLLGLPAELYLKLYHKMQEKVIGYPYYAGCCVPATIEEEPEDNAKYYSEQPKVTKSFAVGEWPMPEEIKERLSKTDYLYMGSISEMAEIRADENIIRKALDELTSKQSAKTCPIPISFARG